MELNFAMSNSNPSYGDHERGSEPLKIDYGADPNVNRHKEYMYSSKSNLVQKCTVFLVVISLSMLIILIGVTSATNRKVDDLSNQPAPPSTVTVAYAALGLSGYENLAWPDVVSLSAGKTVNFWMFGGNDAINDWVDSWLAVQVKQIYDITLVRNSGAAAGAVLQVASERAANNNNNGAVDMIWMNGENFNKMRTANNLYRFATKLPNSVNYDFTKDLIQFDFGNPIEGYEMPYAAAQIVFIYNSKFVNASAIKTVDDLVNWVIANPGKFTYAAPWNADGVK